MASIIPVGPHKFRAQVRRVGHPVMTRTFTAKKPVTDKTIKEAEQAAISWAVGIETDIDTGKKVGVTGLVGITISDAIDRYIKERKDIGKTHLAVLRYLRNGLGSIRLDKLTDQDIVSYIQKKQFSKIAGAMHFSFLGSVLKMAKVGWNYHVPEVIDHARDRLHILGLIGASKARARRPTEKEIQSLLSYDFGSKIPMADIIQFAISTAMRQAEISRIKFSTFQLNDGNGKSEFVKATIVITDRKHPTKKKGNHKTVPLLDKAISIIERQPKGKEFIFPFSPASIAQSFRNACRTLGIVDLHFHDLRHEGTSRLFEMGYKIEEVAMFTGHEDWKMLQRYTHLKANGLREVKQEQVAIGSAPIGGIVMDAETMERFKRFLEFEAFTKGKAA